MNMLSLQLYKNDETHKIGGPEPLAPHEMGEIRLWNIRYQQRKQKLYFFDRRKLSLPRFNYLAFSIRRTTLAWIWRSKV